MSGDKKKKLTLLLDEELYDKFRAISDEQRLPMTAIIRQWLINAPDPRSGKEGSRSDAQENRRVGGKRNRE